MKKIFAITLVFLLGAVTGLQASTIYFGEDLGAGEATRLATHANADAARASFLASLVGVGTETFEGFPTGTAAPLNLVFPGAGTATLTGDGFINSVPTGASAGRYPISGDKFWEARQEFAIQFSSPVAAFGFYGVDIGDFSGQITMTFTNGTTNTVTMDNTVNGLGGSVLYWGIIDSAHPFTKIVFGNTSGGNDAFAFDNMTIGSVEQVIPNVPEPGTLLLLGTGIGALVRKFRKHS
jgi:hypothetical protein